MEHLDLVIWILGYFTLYEYSAELARRRNDHDPNMWEMLFELSVLIGVGFLIY